MNRGGILKKCIWLIALALLSAASLRAQTIRTFAGGGPNNIPGTSAGLNFPLGVTTDANGNLYIADGALRLVLKVDTSGVIRTIAGDGTGNLGYSGDGGPATSAQLSVPSGVAVDSLGNVFIADTNNNVIRKVTASTGIITTVAGNGTSGFSGDGGPATSAQLNFPGDIAVDSAGNLFITDTRNQRIRKVAASTGLITTVVGDGVAGFTGDGGPATSAEVNNPSNVAIDSAGNLFIDDESNNRIRKVAASTGIISTVAGNGTAGFSGDGGPATSAELNVPSDVAVDSVGDIFIADSANELVREVAASTGIITTVAGNGTAGFSGDGGLATSAELSLLGVTVSPAGDLFISEAHNSRIRKVTASTGVITTFAGNGSPYFSGDGFNAGGSQLVYPSAVAVDSADDLFVINALDCLIRRVDASTEIITTVAGKRPINYSLFCGFSGDGGPATSAELNPGSYSGGVIVDSSGNLFIADTTNALVREVTASTGIITTVAGNGTSGFSGDGGPATSAQLGGALSVAVDSSDNFFIADSPNCVIRRVDASTGIITSVAGAGLINGTISCGFNGDGSQATRAELNSPTGVAVDSSGNLFIADSGNNRIRRVAASTGIITTAAGNGTAGFSGDGGPATSAELSFPSRVAVDSSGDVFICDAGNNRIRKVTSTSGIITTVAGNGTFGFSGDGGPATSAELSLGSGCGVAVDSAGDIFIADFDNQRVREVTPGGSAPGVSIAPSPISFGNETTGIKSAPQTVILTNSGTAPVSVTSIAIVGGNAADFAQTNTCGTLPATVAPLDSCNVNVTFTPSMTAAESASLLITDNASNSPQSDPLSGTGTPAAPAASLAPTNVPFGNEIVGTSSAAKTVTVTNTGNANLSITAIAINGANSPDFHQTNTCGTLPATVTPSNSCNVSVSFTPSTTAAESASLVITDNASNSPQSVPLTGNGTDFGIAVASGTSSSATVTAGGKATYTLSVSPLGGFDQTINLSCTGAPTVATCTPSPASLTLDGTNSQNVTVAVTTTARGMLPLNIRPRDWPWNLVRLLLVWLVALMILLGLLGARRLRPQTAFALLVLFTMSLANLAACGGGSSGPPPPTGTPAGTYSLTVTGTSGSLTHKTTVTLTVN